MICVKKYRTIAVHILAAYTFIPNSENKPTVNHINVIKTDNCISNLEWATHSEQIRHAYANGLHSRNCPTRKITDEQIQRIKQLIVDGLYNSEISQITGIPHYSISKIRNNCYRCTDTMKIINKNKRKGMFPDNILHKICDMIDKSYTDTEISNILGYTDKKYIDCISRIRKCKTYTHISCNYKFNNKYKNKVQRLS